MAAAIDPRLATAIRDSKTSDANVHAAFTLRNDRANGPLSPEQTDAIVKSMVARASKGVAKKVGNLVVFKNVQSFAIDAPADVVEKLAAEDSVDTAALGS